MNLIVLFVDVIDFLLLFNINSAHIKNHFQTFIEIFIYLYEWFFSTVDWTSCGIFAIFLISMIFLYLRFLFHQFGSSSKQTLASSFVVLWLCLSSENQKNMSSYGEFLSLGMYYWKFLSVEVTKIILHYVIPQKNEFDLCKLIKSKKREREKRNLNTNKRNI